MRSPRIDDHLGRHSAPVERPVELLALGERHPEILGAVNHLGGGGHFGDPVDRRVGFVHLVVLPEVASHVPRQIVLDVRGGDHAHQVREPGSHAGGHEAVGAGDREGGHVAAVAPSHDVELAGFGHPLLDHQVHPRHEVVHVAEAPVPDVGVAEFLSVAGGTPGVGPQDGKPFLGEVLEHVDGRRAGEGFGVGARRAAMHVQDQRIALPLAVSDREGQ